jgi:hypothetical protein
MPGRDRTGQLGAGPGTGRGMGYCGGYEQSVFAYQATVRGGSGFRHGRAGQGRRHCFYATGAPRWVTSTPEQEAAELKTQTDVSKTQLDTIGKHIEKPTSEHLNCRTMHRATGGLARSRQRSTEQGGENMISRVFGGRSGQGGPRQQGGRGRNSGNKPGSGPGGNCVCPNCGHEEPHRPGQRCIDSICPKCGAEMIKE